MRKKTKRIIFVVVIFLTGFFIVSRQFGNNNSKEKAPETKTSSPLPAFENTLDLNIQEQNYKLVWFAPNNLNKLNLIQNFTQQRDFSEIVLDNSCTFASSGGFYTKENSPTGYFVENGKVIKDWRETDFLNGLFQVDNNFIAMIDNKKPGTTPFIGLQTGPILKLNYRNLNIVSSTDKPARRVFVGIDSSNKVYFFTIYNSSSYFLGPTLSQMSSVLDNTENRLSIKFKDVVNFDGGSASAFYLKGALLTEANYVGSVFCLKE